MSCSANFGNCDSVDANGCERSLTTLTDCGGCGLACAPANATGACGSGSCAIAMCAASYFDVDGLVSSGCECLDDPSSNACNTATPIVAPSGVITPGNSAVMPMTASGKIPLSGMVDWYTVQFTSTGAGAPHIDFMTNDLGAFVFDVFTSCAVAAGGTAGTCGGVEGSTNLTTWDFNDNCAAPSCMTRTVPWPAQIWIRVHRTGAANSCVNYQLHVSA